MYILTHSQQKLSILQLKSISTSVNGVRVVKKKGIEEGRAGVKQERQRASPPIVPSRRQEQPWGQQFHFNHPPWSSYCFSWRTMATPQLSHTHRNMARTSRSVTLTQDVHLLNIQTCTANQKGKVAGWSATVFPLQHSVNLPLKTVMTFRTRTTHVLPRLYSGWPRRPDASAALSGK